MTENHGLEKRTSHSLQDSVPLLKKEVPPPNPEISLRVDGDAGTISLESFGTEIVSVPFDWPTVYSLPTLCKKKKDALHDGLRLKITEKDLATPLGFETLLHVAMINVVSCIFPRISRVNPKRMNLPMHSYEAEVNYIRNAPHFHEYNHLNLFEGAMRGLPLLMALPGPSLDFDYIREHRKKFILMGVGRGAGKLLEAGIVPDIIYIQDVNSHAWDTNLGSLGDRQIPSLLIANPLGRIWKYRHNFRRIIKSWNLYKFEYDKSPRIDEIAPSSTSGAFSAARLLGFKSIVFIGNDCGSSAPPLDGEGIPDSLINLDHKRKNDLLTFEPTRFKKDIRFSFGDTSVLTTSYYLCSAQWLKSYAAQAEFEGGPDIFDRSQTRFAQLNSTIKDASLYEHGPDVSMPVLPYAILKYESEKFVKNRLNSYQLIAKRLRNGKVPNMSLKKPFSAIYCNTHMAKNDMTTPGEGDVEVALCNTQRLLRHTEIALQQFGQ